MPTKNGSNHGTPPLLRSGFRVERWEGFLLVVAYGTVIFLVA